MRTVPPEASSCRQAQPTSGAACAATGAVTAGAAISRSSTSSTMANRSGQPGAASSPGPQLGAHAAQHVLGGHVDLGQLARGQAQQGPGAQRPERDLNAGLGAVVGDQRGRGVQAAEQRGEVAGRLAGDRGEPARSAARPG